jgi:hypothetical protein
MMMWKRFRFFLFVPLSAVFLFAGCRSVSDSDSDSDLVSGSDLVSDSDLVSVSVLVDEPEFTQTFEPDRREFPRGFRFRPEPVPNLGIPPGVGTLSEYPLADSSDPVVSAFREAYVEALLRGLPLEGVLGGDRVHFWPADTSRGRIQNWISGSGEANSWGFPGLVLAIGDAENTRSGNYRVYTVSGRILDRYGRSPGPNIGNGAAGYGYPVGEVFFRDGTAVQRFSKGSVVVDKTGAAFIPDPEDAGPLENDRGGVSDFPQRDFSDTAPDIAGAFYDAVGEALGGAAAERSDGPVVSAVFSDPWIMPGSTIPVSGIYIKSYDTGKSIFVVVDAPALPKRARFLTGPFLAVLLQPEKRIAGAENVTYVDPVPSMESSYFKDLLEGFALYGVPLSDRLPVASTDENADFPFQEAQRFSRGWIIAPVN